MRPFLPAIVLAVALPAHALADQPTALQQTEIFFQALEQGDLEKVRALISDDIVNTLPYAANGQINDDKIRIFRGADEVMAYFGGASQLIPEVRFVDATITVSETGNTVFVENRGDMRLADGRIYENRYVWRLDFEDGQIVKINEYFNPVTAAVAFGRPIGPEDSAK